MRQRLRQRGKCVWNETYSNGRLGSPAPHVKHVGRRLPDWIRDPCSGTRYVSCRAAIATSPCCDKSTLYVSQVGRCFQKVDV